MDQRDRPMKRTLNKKTILLATLSVLTAVSLYVAYDSLRREMGYRQTLSELLIQRDCEIFPALDRPVEFLVDFYGYKYHGKSDNYIDAHILYCGAYEKPELYFLRDVMQAEGGGGVFVDVGANTGQHSMFMSRYSREVHAFEPYPPVLARFREMVSSNGIQNIQVHPVGLGNQNSKLPFYEPPPDNLGTGSFDPSFKSNNQAESILELEIVVGDDEFEKLGISRVDLIKIDIEGYEKPALEGLSRTLQAQRPVVVMELTVDPELVSSFKSEQELRSAFPERYEFLVFDEQRWHGGLGHYALTDFDINFREVGQHNLVIFPSEKASAIPRSNIN